MEPTPPVRRHQETPKRSIIVGTGLVLVLAFIAIIALFFVFSAATPMFVGKCVAVVNIDQELTVDGVSPSLLNSGVPGSDDISGSVDALNKRDDVGAVLFVINSPGGSIVATHDIYDSVKNLNKTKVSYFREMAASGAYYVATGTDYIVSEPDALTGDIGAITEVTQFGGLMDKLGVNVTTIKSGPYKDIGSPYRNMSDGEISIFQSIVDESYAEFHDVVVQNRGSRLNMALFNNVSDGRILSGRQAKRIGLVDALGSKKDALKKAADLGGIEYSSPDDIRVCNVDLSSSQGGLLSAEGFMRSLQSAASGIRLSYK